jgi:F0F1-type ATP synthase assembly protein I
MAIETGLANTTSASSGIIKTFIVAHPITVAVIGGVIVGTGTYWLMNKCLKKKEEPALV